MHEKQIFKYSQIMEHNHELLHLAPKQPDEQAKDEMWLSSNAPKKDLGVFRNHKLNIIQLCAVATQKTKSILIYINGKIELGTREY